MIPQEGKQDRPAGFTNSFEGANMNDEQITLKEAVEITNKLALTKKLEGLEEVITKTQADIILKHSCPATNKDLAQAIRKYLTEEEKG
jgi:hypothetical protein